MKTIKSILTAFVLCTLCAGANAQTVTVADVEALPGETVAFVLNLTEGKANTYTAMQFDAHFPATGFTTTGKYSVSAQWENAMAVIGDVDANGVATIPVASSESISASDVEGLLSVSFTVGSDVAIGDYDVTLKNLWFGYGTSSKDYLDDVTFKVKVVAVHSVILDENSTTLPDAADGVNVSVKRTINAGEWSTICLPFAMSEAQVKMAFGEEVQLGDFCDTQSEYDDADNVEGISVSFKKATEIEANHPYIIKVSQPVTEFAVDNVDIDPAEDDALVEVDNGKTGRLRVFYGGMYGTYHAQTVLEEFSLFLNSNKFWYSKGLTKMKAFRAYFVMADVLSNVDNAEARITVTFIDDETTGVKELPLSKVSVKAPFYDLQGRRVEKPGKGIYVVDGKKVVVK